MRTWTESQGAASGSQRSTVQVSGTASWTRRLMWRLQKRGDVAQLRGAVEYFNREGVVGVGWFEPER